MIYASISSLRLDGRSKQELDDLIRDDSFVRDVEGAEPVEVSTWNMPPRTARRRRRRSP